MLALPAQSNERLSRGNWIPFDPSSDRESGRNEVVALVSTVLITGPPVRHFLISGALDCTARSLYIFHRIKNLCK